MTDISCRSLLEEQTIFAENLKKWLPTHKEEWVWIDRDSVKFYKSYTDAIEDAHRKGLTECPVFIEEVSESFQMNFFPGKRYDR